MGQSESRRREDSSSSGSFSPDSDEARAWAELNEYMEHGPSAASDSRRSGPSGGSTRSYATDRGSGSIPESLRKDFANLEVPFGADIEAVRNAHKRQIRAYHPDRHASDPDKYRIANRITQQVNYSFQRIKQFYEKGIRPEDL